MTPEQQAKELKNFKHKNVYNPIPNKQGKAGYLWRFLRCGVNR